jgi:hypothetical protein
MGRDTTPTPGGRRWLRRRGRVVIVGMVAALAIAAVPAAWATFTDVPPSNPFYADVNAIQGAGITTGCGGGNFCPNDNITRQAEAAFVHRAAGRVALSTDVLDNDIAPSEDFPTDTVVASRSITIGGAAGNVQFAKIEATMWNDYNGGSTPPGAYVWYLADEACTGTTSPFFTSQVSIGEELSPSISWVRTVSTATVETFVLCAYTGSDDHVGVNAVSLNVMTVPFGSGGANTLGAEPAQFPRPSLPG